MKKKEKLKIFEEYSLYGITDSKISKTPVIKQVEEMIKGGIRIIQYREKYKDFSQKYLECLKIREITAKNKVIFIVNDHPDLAMMTKADGVHLGQDDYPVEAVRRLVGKEMIIGISTHNPKQYIEAVKSGADYVGVGPLFETHTKEDVIPPVGIKYLRWVVRNKKIPFVAIGGIKENNIDLVIKEGARCICLVSDIVTSPDISAKVKRLISKFPQDR